jgi:sigma-B regulation protein RsbU (phosphoserine phosphatase)
MSKDYNNYTTSDKPTDSQKIASELELLHAKVDALSSLMEVSIIINSTLDLDELIILVMEKAQKVMKAEASSVMIVNEEKGVLECPVALGEVGDKIKKIEIPMNKGIAGWVATHNEPQIVPDAYKDPRFNPKIDEETGFTTRSILAAPLKVKDRTIGVAEVINHIDKKAFDMDDLELFSTFCRQVAMAVENARIHQLELEKQRIEQQLEAAKFIQQSFMPESFPVLPGQKFEVAAKTIEAASVGGDFFDFIEFDNTKVGFTMGDVCGKGIPAALFMARMVSDFRLYTQVYEKPSQVLDALNKILYNRSRRGMFVTSIYGILNFSVPEFIFSNAGHLPVIKIDGKENSVELINENKGIPLGITADFTYELVTIPLETNDSIVLITDGVIEAKNKTDKAYSFERVMDVLSQPQETAQEIVDLLLNDIQNFSEGAVQHDDLTIVVIKWK